jgi:hypothetical protein
VLRILVSLFVLLGSSPLVMKKKIGDTQIQVWFLIWKMPKLMQQYEMVGIDHTHPTLTSNVFDDVVCYLLPWVREDFPFYAIFILIRFLIMEEEFLLGN